MGTEVPSFHHAADAPVLDLLLQLKVGFFQDGNLVQVRSQTGVQVLHLHLLADGHHFCTTSNSTSEAESSTGTSEAETSATSTSKAESSSHGRGGGYADAHTPCTSID